MRESIEGTGQEQRAPTGFKQIATEVRKAVAETLRDIIVMITAEAAK